MVLDLPKLNYFVSKSGMIDVYYTLTYGRILKDNELEMKVNKWDETNKLSGLCSKLSK